MNNSHLKLLILPLIIVIITLIVTVAIMAPLIPLPLSDLILDGTIFGLLLAILNFLLKEIIRYSNYKSLPIIQQIVNYGALAILFVLSWVGISFLIVYIVSPENAMNYVLPTVPIRITLALLSYGLLILLYGYIFTQNQEEEVSIDIDVEHTTDIESSEKAMTNEDSSESEILEHIAVKNGQKIDLIFINDIISIQAEGNYVMIFTPKGKYLKEQTMKYFGDHLPANKFVRVHRSNIINIDYIQRIELYEKQSQMLKLQNNLQVKMSIAGYKELKRVLNL
ncbi:LytTR family transcriptional regulator [Dysgonomonas sp. HDW5B]|uniref:LytR/AlgR family response regulator transcription factor n=1 Tax=Dysgonomonas sp. HDW5B TaxID=2714927 RepID=UPI00140873C0|nr:LytTR family DNA-binding domain-containing protein [Dysgonomonas sp. HDW5B]QIK53900.1 LytTR family transcriptional regulator [Dysgonomonas sp. HDW5B]